MQSFIGFLFKESFYVESIQTAFSVGRDFFFRGGKKMYIPKYMAKILFIEVVGLFQKQVHNCPK